MSEQAKSLLSVIRKQRGRWIMTGNNPMFGPPMVEASPFDEMLELYIAARESDDLVTLRAELTTLKEKHEKLSEATHDLRDKARSADFAKESFTRRLGDATDMICHLLREGDIICLEKYSHKERRKVIGYDFTAKSFTYVNWDKRRKGWCSTHYYDTVELMLANAGTIVQIERPGDVQKDKTSK